MLRNRLQNKVLPATILNLKECLSNGRFLLGGCLIIFFGAIATWVYATEMQIRIPLEGFSPIDWVNRTLFPQNFIHNFPSGVETFDTSAWMWLYKGAAHYFKISPDTLMPWMIGLELVFYSVVVLFVGRSLFPSLPWSVVLACVPLMVASTARDMNLARYGQPFFIGQFYNIADAARLAGIIFLLQQHPIRGALGLGISYMSHAAMGLMGAVFAAGMFLPNLRLLLDRKYIWAGSILVLFIGVWTAYMTSLNLSGHNTPFPESLWFQWTELFNRHWYPVKMGVFTTLHQERFLPFLCFLAVLFALYPRLSATRTPQERDMDIRLLWGMSIMGLLIVAGILFSVWKPSPTLVKLSLHRANDLIITFGWFYLMAGCWEIFKSSTKTWGNWLQKILAGTLLISPFLLRPAVVFLFAVLFCVLEVVRTLKVNRRSFATWISLGIMGFIVLWGFFWAQIGVLGDKTDPAYTGGIMAVWIVGLSLVWTILSFWGSSLKISTATLSSMLSLMLFGLGGWWLFQHHQQVQPMASQSADYKAAQLWAKDHTPGQAVFLVDPTIYYGWRDFSQRSSFGNIREWLMLGWFYASNTAVYQEGLQRFHEFGIDPTPYFHAPTAYQGGDQLSETVTHVFYGWNDATLQAIASRYGLCYGLLRRALIQHPYNLTPIFKNNHYIILQLSPCSHDITRTTHP